MVFLTILPSKISNRGHRKDGRTEGRKDGRTEGRKEGRKEGRTPDKNELKFVKNAYFKNHEIPLESSI